MISMSDQPKVLPAEFDPEDEYRPEPEPEPLPPIWLDGSKRIGIHTSIAGSVVNALEAARKLGCNALQIFSASPRMWQSGSARIAEADGIAFRARREELALGPLVIHANYLINLAAQEPMLRTRSIQAFQDEVMRAAALGADFLVVHPGARGEASIEQAIATIVESVKQASKRVKMGRLRILIENTAGMGTAVGSRLEEVGQILYGLRGVPVGACLDTAHLFAAGYDIKSEKGFAATLDQIEAAIGLEKVPVFHVNDSKIELGGKVDRHEHIGKGKIGAEAFARLLTHPKLSSALPEGVAGRAFVAETPIDEPGDDRRNVAKLWELAGLKEQAPEAEKGFSMMTATMKNNIAAHQKMRKREGKNKDNAEARRTQSHAEKTRTVNKTGVNRTRVKKKALKKNAVKSKAKKKRG